MTDTLSTRVIQIDPRAVKLLDLNAHYMPHETFARLVKNVKDDGKLTQLPFGWWLHDDATQARIVDAEGNPIPEVLSGNHRVQAAAAAGLTLIDFLITDDYLPPDRRKAIQLSHNAIFGQDDPVLLKTLYDSIGDVDLRLYSGLDDKTLDLLPNVPVAALSEASLEFQTISLVFLPDEVEQIQALWDRVLSSIAPAQGLWLARWRDYDGVMDSLEAASLAHGVRNTATALLIVLDIFQRHMDELTEGYLNADGEPIEKNRQVPIASVLGTDRIPARVAALLKKAIDRAVNAGEIENDQRWRILEQITEPEVVDHA